MQVSEITPGFGAEITEIDLNEPMSPETEADLVSAIATYGVLVFPDSGLTDQTHVWFSRMFGNLWTIPGTATATPRFGYPHLFDAGNLTRGRRDQRRRTRPTPARGRPAVAHRFLVHQGPHDLFAAARARGARPRAAQTWFADMRAAYDALARSRPSSASRGCRRCIRGGTRVGAPDTRSARRRSRIASRKRSIRWSTSTRARAGRASTSPRTRATWSAWSARRAGRCSPS